MIKRWVILQHTISKDSLEGLHFDLLLEDGKSCRSWRLDTVPELNGPSVVAVPSVAHKLYWLEREEAFVSADMSWAKRIHRGNFYGSLPKVADEFVCVEIISSRLSGTLHIGKNFCKLIFSP